MQFCNMCVLALRSCSTTCIVLCLWSWEFHEVQDCLVLGQCPWHPETSLGTLCRRLSRKNSAINLSLFGDWRISIDSDWIDELFFWSSSSLNWSGPPCTRRSIQRTCSLSLLSRSGFPCAVSMYGRMAFFPRWFHVCLLFQQNCMCVQFSWLAVVSHRMEFLSPNSFLKFQNSHQCFWWHGVIQNNRNAAGLIIFQSSVLCDVQVKCVHCIKVWSLCGRILWNRAVAPPMGP